MKEIQINGCVQIPEGQTHDEFWDKFITWVEGQGYEFGGGTEEVKEGEDTSVEIYARNKAIDFGNVLIRQIIGSHQIRKNIVQKKYEEFIKETR